MKCTALSKLIMPLLGVTFFFFGQSSAAQTPVTIPDTQQIELQSNINEQRYFLQVALPRGYEKSDEKYPVVYLLDANADFPLVTSIARRLQVEEATSNFMVVGISYPENAWYNRRRDYTPTKAEPLEQSGGGPDFRRILETEVIPLIDTQFKTKKGERTFLGHSLGALFGAYLIANDTALFSNYIISSPSLWWDDYSVIAAPKSGLNGRKVFAQLTVGKDENPHMVGSWQKLTDFMNKHMPASTVKSGKLEGEDHTTAKFRAYADGLRWLYRR